MKPGAVRLATVDMARRGSEPCTEHQTSYTLHKQNYGLDLLSRLNAFRSEAAFTDAILCVGHEEFPCHRNVLAVSSPYFRAMFTSDLKESREIRISFNEVSPWTLKRVIDYAYSGRLEITQENAQEMLAAGNLFQYLDIVDACCKFFTKQLHPSNCFGIENFALMHSCEQLQEEANKFALENFSSAVEYDEFMDQSLERILPYISSDLIDVRSEETVYDAIMRWIKYDLDERKPHLSVLLEEIRLPVIDINRLRAMENDSLLQCCDKCVQMIHEAILHHESGLEQHKQRRRSMQNKQVLPRPSTVAKEVVVVICGINNYITKSVEMYDPQKEKWFSLPDFQQAVSWFSVAAVSNSILVTGGIQDGHIVPHVWKFDGVKRTWHQMAPMLKPRARHASAVLDDRLYIIGGITANIVDVESIECYDSSSNKWTTVGEANFPRKQSRVVSHNNTLVEVGGLQGSAKVKTMDSYLCNQGIVKPAGEQFVLPEVIEYSQIVVLNGVFYIIWEDSKKVIALNPEKRTFRRLPDMHYAHLYCGTAVLNGKIYVTGGLIDSKPSQVVECYDPHTNSWTIEKSMIEGRAYHGCVSLQMC